MLNLVPLARARGKVAHVDPREAQRGDVRGVDLRQRAETLARVVTVVHRPHVGTRLKELRRIETGLRSEQRGADDHRAEEQQ